MPLTVSSQNLPRLCVYNATPFSLCIEFDTFFASSESYENFYYSVRWIKLSREQTIRTTVNIASDSFVNALGRICSCVTRRKAIRENRMWHVGVKWSEVARTTAGRFLFFFFFPIAQRSRCVNVYRRYLNTTTITRMEKARQS